MSAYPPEWMVEVAAASLPTANEDPEGDVAAGMARLLRGLCADVGRSGMSFLRPEELRGLAQLLDPRARHWPLREGGFVAVLCERCVTLGGHQDDCPELEERDR